MNIALNGKKAVIAAAGDGIARGHIIDGDRAAINRIPERI